MRDESKLGLRFFAVVVSVLLASASAGAAAATDRADRLAVIDDSIADGEPFWTGVALAGSDTPLVTAPSVVGPLDWTIDGDELVYQVDDSDEPELRAFNSETAATRVLFEGRGRLSPNEQLVATTEGDAVRVANTGSQAGKALTDPELAPIGPDLDWDSASSRIVYRAMIAPRRLSASAAVVSVETGRNARITPMDMAVGVPRWSPSDDLIAFPADGELWTVRPDGSDLRRVTSFEAIDAAVRDVVAWSPDGRQIAFPVRANVSTDVPRIINIWVYNFEDDSLRPLAGELEHNCSCELRLSWSADARRLAFEAPTYGSDYRESFVYDLRVGTGERRRIDPIEGSSPLGEERAPAYSPGVTVRASGTDRTATAVDVSRRTFPRAATVVVARSDRYPDALAGATLAASVNGPLLLTRPGVLDDGVVREIARLGADTAYVLGDTSAISGTVQQTLERSGLTVRRLAGEDRYATAAAIASEVGGSHVYLAQGVDPDPGRGWPDAVAVSGLAGLTERPVLLTAPDRLPTPTVDALDALAVERVTIVGGARAVSEEVAESLRIRGIVVDRLAGENRYETSLAVAAAALNAGASTKQLYLTTGRNWPDSLSAGSAAAVTGGVLLMVDGRGPAVGSSEFMDWLSETRPMLDRVWLVGGPDVLDPLVGTPFESYASDN